MTIENVKKYGFIDALRGYAILGVLLVHSSLAIPSLNPYFSQIASLGRFGVQLFYLASALTLCMSWASRSVHELYPIRNFYIRRFFRIAPMFYIAIVFYRILYGLASCYWAPSGIKLWYIFSTALFLHGFHPETINSVVPGGWSIAVEMNFYLILPFLVRHLVTPNALMMFFVASLIISSLSKMICIHILPSFFSSSHLLVEFSTLNFFSQLPVFIMGMQIYFINKKPTILKKILGTNFIILLIFLILSLLLTKSPNTLLGIHVWVSFIFVLFVLFLAKYPRQLLVNKTVVFLGKISFSMYIIHFAVLEIFSRIGISAMCDQGIISNIIFFLLFVTAVIPLAYFFYVTIEQYGILIGKKVISSWSA